MAEKNLNARIVHKHDTEANWLKAVNFIPKQGELIVYDVDATYNYERIKIGDGATLVSALPFVDDAVKDIIDEVSSDITNMGTQLNNIGTLVGDTAVSEQIEAAQIVHVGAVAPTDQNIQVWVDTANDPAFIVPNLPEVTAADNGKVLMVVNGRWQAVKMNLSVDANGVVSM